MKSVKDSAELTFPEVPARSADTLRALQSYARVIGAYRAALVPLQKHWWHASLLPSARGFRTGPIYRKDTAFELKLDLEMSKVRFESDSNTEHPVALTGQSSADLYEEIQPLLRAINVVVQIDKNKLSAETYPRFSWDTARQLQRMLRVVVAAMTRLKAEIREESSPVQLWPHHFDTALLILTGDRVPGADPDDPEQADAQINIGFSFGDAPIPEPYFYVTFYPQPADIDNEPWRCGARWHHEAWQGVALPYNKLLKQDEPAHRLRAFWQEALDTGRRMMRPT